MVINLLSNTKTLRKDRWGCERKKTRLRPQRVPKSEKEKKERKI